MSKGLTSAELSLKSVDWVRLEIIDKSQQGDNGYVEFNATFMNEEGNEDVQNEKMRNRSLDASRGVGIMLVEKLLSKSQNQNQLYYKE